MASLRPRGSTLATVLIVTTLVLVVGLALASTAVLNLNAGQSAVNLKQAELGARAAISQFIYDTAASGDPGPDVTTPPSGVVVPPIRAHYAAHPVLFRSDDPEVVVDTQFDPTLEYFSTDNSQGPTAVAGWNRQVPAFSTYLVLRVRCNRLTRYFGVLLQQGWPYACTAVPPARVGVPNAGGTGFDCSLIQGNFFAYSPAELPIPGPANPEMIPLDRDLYGHAAVGGSMGVTGPIEIAGGLSKLQGNVDTEAAAAPTVAVSSGGQWVGRPRTGISNSTQIRRLMQIMTYPGPPASAVDLDAVAGSYLGAGVDTGASVTPVGARLFEKDVLQLGTSPSPGIPAAPYYSLRQSGGNRHQGYWEYNAPLRKVLWQEPVRSTGEGHLVLNNCVLYVRGNLDFQGRGSGFTLDGDNSTLIVEGTLTLEDTALNSGSQGMVILCRNLVLSGRGNFRGLLVARNSAIVVCKSSETLVIEGGIICGDRPVTYALYDASTAVAGPDVDAEATLTTLVTPPSLQLAGAKVTYNPRYMRGLTGAGEFRVVSFQSL